MHFRMNVFDQSEKLGQRLVTGVLILALGESAVDRVKLCHARIGPYAGGDGYEFAIG